MILNAWFPLLKPRWRWKMTKEEKAKIEKIKALIIAGFGVSAKDADFLLDLTTRLDLSLRKAEEEIEKLRNKNRQFVVGEPISLSELDDIVLAAKKMMNEE